MMCAAKLDPFYTKDVCKKKDPIQVIRVKVFECNPINAVRYIKRNKPLFCQLREIKGKVKCSFKTKRSRQL